MLVGPVLVTSLGVHNATASTNTTTTTDTTNAINGTNQSGAVPTATSNNTSTLNTISTVKLYVVTSVFSITNIVKNVGGDKIKLTGLVPEGVNSHTFELVPSDVVKVNNVDL